MVVTNPPGIEDKNIVKIPVKRLMDFLYIGLVAFVLLIVYLTYPRTPHESSLSTDFEIWEATKPATTQPFIRIKAVRDKSTGQYKDPVTISIKDADNTIWTFHIPACAPSDIAADHIKPDGESAGWLSFKRISREEIPFTERW